MQWFTHISYQVNTHAQHYPHIHKLSIYKEGKKIVYSAQNRGKEGDKEKDLEGTNSLILIDIKEIPYQHYDPNGVICEQ